jgi:hypothetical protein
MPTSPYFRMQITYEDASHADITWNDDNTLTVGELPTSTSFVSADARTKIIDQVIAYCRDSKVTALECIKIEALAKPAVGEGNGSE